MGTGSATGPISSFQPQPARWRLPVAIALAAASVPLAFVYGYGTVPALVALVVLWPVWQTGQRTAMVWVAAASVAAGLVFGGLMLVAAVGLCGPGVLVGSCNA